MKTFRLACPIIAVAALMSVATSCSSDPTTIGLIEPIDNNSDKATIILNLSAAATRADEDSWATDDEKIINKVNVYVFDENDVLAEVDLGVEVKEGKSKAIEVSHGLKRIYAISAYNLTSSQLNTGTLTVTDFEKQTFESTLSKLQTEDGFVMIGNSGQQMVMQSASDTDIPASNIFNIAMTRALAKAQVKCTSGTANTGSATSGLAVGINFDLSVPSFKACQKNNTMRVVPSGDLSASYTEHTNGTCAGYTRMNGEYTEAQSAFTADNCCYMPENIVNSPISGNTTFLSIRFVATPKQYYAYSEENESKLETASAPATPGTFYAVGIANEAAGFVDYVLTKNGSGHDFVIFASEDDADKYVASLNNEQASVITVSDSDSPLKIHGAATRSEQKFQKFKFVDGNVYYRVNVKEGNECKVVRNKFYKVDITSVKSLGFSSEEYLFPTDPSTSLDQTASSWVQANFTVVPWTEVNQSVEL